MSGIARFGERVAIDVARGALYDGDVRYLLIRPDSLMGMFARLPPQMRREALAALADSVAESGGRSVARYRRLRPDADIVDEIAATAPQLGWGTWQLARAPGVIRLTVANSPFAACADNGPACAPIVGMLRALASVVFATPASVVETSCVADGAPACSFEAEPSYPRTDPAQGKHQEDSG